MCDTFRPLFPTNAALELDDPNYPNSWQGEHFPKSIGQHHPNGEHKSAPSNTTSEKDAATVNTWT